MDLDCYFCSIGSDQNAGRIERCAWFAFYVGSAVELDDQCVAVDGRKTY